MKSVAPGFDVWYRAKEQEMRADQTMAYFYKVRSEILKEGKMVLMHHLQMSGDITSLRDAVPQPHGARRFFVGDHLGGSGWEVELPNGDRETFYVQLPEVPGVSLSIDLHFAEAPTELRDIPAAELAQQYIDKLAALVTEAKRTFTGS